MTRLHWSSQLLPAHAPSSSSHILASFFFPLCTRRDGGILCGDRTLTYHVADHHHQSPFLGSRLLPRNRSSEFPKGRGRRREGQNLRRACSASLESFTDDNDDEEVFVIRLQELAFQLERQEEDDGVEPRIHSESRRNLEAESSCGASTSYYDDALPSCYSVSSSSLPSSSEPSGRLEPPEWPASVERNANSVDLPLSLRIIKRKKQQRWVEGSLLREAACCCSVKKAFSSMVFIVRELYSFALRMQHTLVCEDIQGMLASVQQEIHASFVWLFQRIFSCTPTLMVSLMLLLANYTVYSMGHYSTAIAAPPHRSAVVVTHHQPESKNHPRFDHSSIKTFSVTGRTASVGGSGGGGGRKVRPVAGPTDDGRSDESFSSSYRSHTMMPPDGISTVPATGGGEDQEGSSTVMEEKAARTWSKIVEEASRMQASSRDGALMDLDTLNRLVSPVTVELEPEDRSDHLRTELNYQQFLAQEPDNPLLLSNFAQFLFLVLRDHDRAEHYFKRAVGTELLDAEALARYASFLWLARKDLAAAEETYLEAIAADPGNTVHAANYAHFLWSTGGEDTCYPLDADDA
ncbi:hypothetical protein COCNU_12G008640 [Cocos nucifera]|uniref:Uncharacterized protein n=1 Tax=Cocos nucifera TaxID=13894 RepID=A0A8K0ISB5_COCNU|nr:hypothetical protein COCNU_12G008640 [Cocos nucifera]